MWGYWEVSVMPLTRTLYDILECEPGASIEEITESYRRLVKRFADDRQAFEEVTSAYMRLANPADRARYDEELHRHRQTSNAREPASPRLICPSCHAENPPEAEYCIKCGLLLRGQARFADTERPHHHMPKLGMGRLVRTDGAGHYSFCDPVTNIGRGPSNDISLPDDRYLSTHHARIHCDIGLFAIEDLGSTNGTFVNGVRIVAGQRAALTPGCEVRLGRSVFRFEVV